MTFRFFPGWRHFFYQNPYPFSLADVEVRDDTELQVHFLGAVLGGRRNILDLGCGEGRHARRLTARGLEVVGVDAAPQPEALNFRYIRADLSAIPVRSESADALYSMYSSLGYNNDIRKQLKEWARIGKPNALLVIDLANRGHRLKYARDFFSGGTGWMISFRVSGRRYQTNISRYCGVISMHSFSYPEPRLRSLMTVLAETGWRTERVWGDFDNSVYERASRRLIVVACRL